MAEGSNLILCPYCGTLQQPAELCRACGGLFESLSQRATQIAMGPWFVRDPRQPFRPGCSYQVLKRQIASGRIRASSVLRGPTTHQFWRRARAVPGVAHLLGYCYQCGQQVKPTARVCPHCEVAFMEVLERNELGLQYPTDASAAKAQQELDRQLAQSSVEQPQAPNRNT